MRLDAVITAAVAIASSLLLLSLYMRASMAYVGAWECYRRALVIAADAARSVSMDTPPSPPDGWRIEVFYANKTLTYGEAFRVRCWAYTITSEGGEVVLIKVEGG